MYSNFSDGSRSLLGYLNTTTNTFMKTKASCEAHSSLPYKSLEFIRLSLQ